MRSTGMLPSRTWQISVPDRPPQASLPGILPNSPSLHRNAALEMWRGRFVPAQDALLGLEELLQHQHCQGAASHPAGELGAQGKGHSPQGHSKVSPWDKELSPRHPDQLTDTQMGTETPEEAGTCLPLQLCFYGLMFFRIPFSAAFPQSPIYAGAKIFAVTS